MNFLLFNHPFYLILYLRLLTVHSIIQPSPQKVQCTYIVSSENIICFSTKLPGNFEVIKITYAQLTFTFNIIISLFSVKAWLVCVCGALMTPCSMELHYYSCQHYNCIGHSRIGGYMVVNVWIYPIYKEKVWCYYEIRGQQTKNEEKTILLPKHGGHTCSKIHRDTCTQGPDHASLFWEKIKVFQISCIFMHWAELQI